MKYNLYERIEDVMKMLKRIMAVGMILGMSVLSLSGCGTKEGDLLAVATKAANEAKSMEVDATMDMGMKMTVDSQSQEMNIKAVITMSAFQEPLKAKMDMKMDMGAELGSMDMQTYIAEANGEYVTYMKLPETGWVKQVIGNSSDMKKAQEQVNQFDAKMFLSDDVKLEEQEDVEENGTKYKVFNGKITKNMIDKLMSNIDSMANMTGIDDSEESKKIIDEVTKDMDDILYTIWIEPKEKTLYRVKISMAEFMEKIIKKTEEMAKEQATPEENELNMKTEIKKMDMDIIYKNYNKAVDFEVPKEALNAKVADPNELIG